jgi:hypothetical protein
MNKRTKTPPPDDSVFRDSDFAGAEPGVQARLSASLNTLNSRVVTAKRALADLGKAGGSGETPTQPPPEPPPQAPEEGVQPDPRG